MNPLERGSWAPVQRKVKASTPFTLPLLSMLADKNSRKAVISSRIQTERGELLSNNMTSEGAEYANDAKHWAECVLEQSE